MHDLPLVATIAAAFSAAWLLGLLAQWLRLSPIVGYLLAGVAIGPYTPGFIGDPDIAHQLAEVGVILLMFGVGLHFHPRDLLAVRGLAIPGAVVQSLVATVLGMVVFAWFEIPLRTGMVMGMAMAVASTVVLMRALTEADAVNSPEGHVAVGWLIVEDIFTVILLVLIPVLGGAPQDGTAAAPSGQSAFWTALGVALLKLGALVAVVLVVGSRVVPWVLVRVARLRSRELFTLTVLVFSIAIAAGSYFFFGASMALGAFLAGMVVAQSPVSHQAAAEALPLRDAFAVLFFVSVGMLFDPSYLIRHPLMVLAATGIVLIAKPLAALAIVAVLGHSSRTALTVALGLAQIGEFSFILSELARRHGLMPDAGHHVIVSSAILTITLNPALFRSLAAVESWLRARPFLWKLLNGRAERRVLSTNDAAAASLHQADGGRGLAIVIGYGPVGRSVNRLLRDAHLNTVVIDLNMDTVSSLHAAGQSAIFGDASNAGILEQAGVQRASHVVLTVPDPAARAAVVAAARLNANVRILVRARYLRERSDLEHAGATAAVFEEAEAAVALARLVLADTGVHREAAKQKINELRLQLIVENLSNIQSQRVRSVMVPWARVRGLSSTADRNAVMALVAQHGFSRWPVVDAETGQVRGYLLAKDLVAHEESDWRSLVRPLKDIGPEDTVASVLSHMQSEGDTVYLVKDGPRPVGLITLEDILEQVVGRIEDEYPHEAGFSLRDAAARGGILDLAGQSRDEVIKELAAAIPAEQLPRSTGPAQIAALALAREDELPTDLGNGVAIPHARCPELSSPVVVFGRSAEGVVFSPGSQEPVHLVFLIVAPAEQPEAQLALLSQVGRVCAEERNRRALMAAESPQEMLAILDTAR